MEWLNKIYLLCMYVCDVCICMWCVCLCVSMCVMCMYRVCVCTYVMCVCSLWNGWRYIHIYIYTCVCMYVMCVSMYVMYVCRSWNGHRSFTQHRGKDWFRCSCPDKILRSQLESCRLTGLSQVQAWGERQGVKAGPWDERGGEGQSQDDWTTWVGTEACDSTELKHRGQSILSLFVSWYSMGVCGEVGGEHQHCVRLYCGILF